VEGAAEHVARLVADEKRRLLEAADAPSNAPGGAA
jgi:hypothetical protein